MVGHQRKRPPGSGPGLVDRSRVVQLGRMGVHGPLARETTLQRLGKYRSYAGLERPRQPAALARLAGPVQLAKLGTEAVAGPAALVSPHRGRPRDEQVLLPPAPTRSLATPGASALDGRGTPRTAPTGPGAATHCMPQRPPLVVNKAAPPRTVEPWEAGRSSPTAMGLCGLVAMTTAANLSSAVRIQVAAVAG